MAFYNYNLLLSDVTQLAPSVWSLSRSRLQTLLRSKPWYYQGLYVIGGDGSHVYNISQNERAATRFWDSGKTGVDRIVFTPDISGLTPANLAKTRFSFYLAAEDYGIEEIELSKGDYAGVDFNGSLSTSALKVSSRGADVVTGTIYADTLYGSGKSTLKGGKGNDAYQISLGDTVNELNGEGNDTVLTGFTYVLPDNVENLELIGVGAINASGNSLNNNLKGNPGDNTLDGKAGNDTMSGGAGNDIYVVDATGDAVVENFDEGYDTVQTTVSWTLGPNIENLVLTGTAAIQGSGNNLDNVLIGNEANNTLSGGPGADTLNGGAGNDTLIGGPGNDCYVINNPNQTIQEKANEGLDQVETYLTYVLPENVENLVLKGSGKLFGTGNSLDNAMYGNADDNLLDGKLGADTLTGGSGDDTYVVDNQGDVVLEKINEGSDTIQSSVSLKLGPYIENLVLTGTDNLNATGNSLNNNLTGNAGDNTLDGGGGNDTMSGGAGDDVYSLDSEGDKPLERFGEGKDTVFVSFGARYSLGENIENAVSTGLCFGLTGNSLNNYLRDLTVSGDSVLDGGAGNDRLCGGTGRDKLTGGAGADVFEYGVGDALIGPSLNNFEVITDFEAGLDVIDAPGENLRPVNVAWSQKRTLPGDFTSEHFENQFYRMEGLSPGGACAVILGTLSSPRTFLILDSNNNGFDLSDNVIEITGYTGSLCNITVI